MIDIDVSKIVSEIGEPKARLIENEDEKKQKMYMQIFSFVFFILFIIGLVVFFFLYRNTASKAEAASKQVKILEENNATLVNVENQAQFILNRNRNVLAIIRDNPTWSYVFETIEEVVPKGITFTRFEVESPEVMRINGISPDYETLSKLAVSMSGFTLNEGGKESNVFGNVSVVNASLSRSQSGAVQINFTISFSFVKKINKESVNPLPAETTPAAPVAAPTEELPTDSQETVTLTPEEMPVVETPPAPEPTPEPSQEGGLPVL